MFVTSFNSSSSYANSFAGDFRKSATGREGVEYPRSRINTAPEPCKPPFLEEVDRVVQTFQKANFLALFLSEVILMLEYKMFPYIHCPGPLETANEALWWDLMLILYMPFNLLASLIAFIATIVMAGPLLGAR